MGYYDAIEDKIPMSTDKDGFDWYYPPCRICGEGVKNWGYIRGREYCCPECRRLLVEYHAGKTGDRDTKERRFNIAVKRIARKTDIDMYERAIETVHNNLHRKGWFQSTEEIMTAIELIKQGYKINHQVRIYDYRVDFVIPKLKTILEIDGKPFHGRDKEQKRIMRDEVLLLKFGEDWDIIHIDTENINTNITKLLPAIRAMKRNRRKTKRVQ